MKVLAALLMFVSVGVVARAQTPPTPAPMPMPAPVISDAKVTGGIELIHNKGVKNAPFSAEAISESVQTLADGNRIVRSSTSKLYRNSEGRFRQEVTGGTGGMMGSFFSYGPGVTIMHPFEGQRIFLDSHAKIAHVYDTEVSQAIRVVTPKIAVAPVEMKKAIEAYKVAGQNSAESKAAVEKLQAEIDKARVEHDVEVVTQHVVKTPVGVGQGVGVGVGKGVRAAPVPGSLWREAKWDSRTEELGEQNIEGVSAKGTRTITTIPAGAIGNERPIETIYEKWYSDELQMVVYSKSSDPRFGEQTYRLTNIDRNEPDPALFQPPPGYKKVSGGPGGAYTVTAARTLQAELEAAKASRPAVKKIKNQN
jgi:hypothetical protein